MKTVAELIAELQKIPNPEKVGISLFNEDYYIPLSKDYNAAQTNDFIRMTDIDTAKAKAQGIESVVTF